MDRVFSPDQLERCEGNTLAREAATPQGTNELAVANFNVENLAGNEPALRFNQLADLVVTNIDSDNVSVLLSNPDGTFPAARTT